MAEQYPSILKNFTAKRIIWPILIGLAVVGYMFVSGFDEEAFRIIVWDRTTAFWLTMAVLMMVVRHIAYMWRIRKLTDGRLTWGRSYSVIMLWEFASAATPSIVGGTAFAFFLLNKEGLSKGKSTTLVLFTSFLDEAFFILAAPIFFLIAGLNFILPQGGEGSALDNLIWAFAIGYNILMVYTAAIAYGLFIRPRGLKWIIIKMFSWKWLLKWREDAVKVGEEVVVTSKELQQRDLKYWLHASISTIISWTARYFVVNCIIMAFTTLDDQFIVYARQIVMWVIMLVTPTPGSSGMAELVFSNFLREYIPNGLEATLALIWRTISYYPYLFLGVILLPRWLRRVYQTKKEE